MDNRQWTRRKAYQASGHIFPWMAISLVIIASSQVVTQEARGR